MTFADEKVTLLQGSKVKPMHILLPDERRTALLSLAPVFDEVGDVLGLLCMLSDLKEYDGVPPVKQGSLAGARPLLEASSLEDIRQPT